MNDRPRGRLKIFMGYAAGVGKTYQMLEEAQQLKSKDRDVVIGYFEPHNRQETIEKAQGLEIVPRKKIDYRQSTFEEMDTEAILARRPAGGRRRRVSSYECAGIGPDEALGRRASAAGRGPGRVDDYEHSASGKPE